MTPDELKAAQDAAIAAAAGRQLTPEPGGLAGRVAREHDAAAEALDAGDVDAAIGHDIAAKALSAALLAERPVEARTHRALIARQRPA